MLDLHQITLESPEEANRVRALLLGGAPWDSLATRMSVDAHRYRGGKHNTKPLADVEFAIRDAIAELAPGEISAVFPYADHYSIVRLDDRRPADPGDLPRYESGIRRYLLETERQRAWDAFVAEHLARSPVARNEEILETIRADSTLVLRGEFRTGSNALALRLDDRFVVDERELRLAVSRAAMENADRPFQSHLEATVDAKSRELVLAAAAEAAGYFSEPDVVRLYERDLRTSLIEAYLAETVVPKIVFNREEFEMYYREHAEDYAEPDQVQLATLLVDEEATAREMAERLREGADFAYVKRQYIGPDDALTQREPKWSAVTLFSDEIREQLDRMEIGGTSEALDIGHNWLVFKLLDRKPGPVKELSEVEHEIRQVMFNRKFKSILDEHLALLKERSEIERFPEAIADYLEEGS
jgi:parvulin-like peptidyl-prolyl isomerase